MGFVSRDVELFIVRRLCYSYLLTICHYGNGRSLALGSMVLNVVFYLVPSTMPLLSVHVLSLWPWEVTGQSAGVGKCVL